MSGGGSVALGSSVTLTNAGVTSVTAGTGISVSASTGGITVTNTSVNAGTGLGDIGSYARLAYCTTANVIAGNTVSGSNLRYQSTISNTALAGFPAMFSEGNGTTLPWTDWYYGQNIVTKSNSGNTGIQTPAGSTAMTGTWRAMESVRGAQFAYDSCGNNTNSDYVMALFVRIS